MWLRKGRSRIIGPGCWGKGLFGSNSKLSKQTATSSERWHASWSRRGQTPGKSGVRCNRSSPAIPANRVASWPLCVARHSSALILISRVVVKVARVRPVTRYLLDTNIISNVVKPQPSELLLAWMAVQRDEDLFIASLTLAEIRRGILRSRKARTAAYSMRGSPARRDHRRCLPVAFYPSMIGQALFGRA